MKEALKLALEALEYLMTNKTIHYTYRDKAEEAITACEQALAAPVQKRPQNCGTGYCSCIECVIEPELVQEPVAWRYDLKRNGSFAGVSTEYSPVKLSIGENWTPLYTTPPAAQRQWVSLTNEDYHTNMFSITSLGACDIATIKSIAKDVEAKLKERNQ
jgi:hypothetical protein